MIQSILEPLYSNPLFMTIAVGVSVALFIGSLALLPFLAALIPEDYFLPAEQQHTVPHRPSWRILRILFHVIKNLLGIVLLLAGLIMFFTPGQGLLTVFIGLLFIDFPGKRALELALIRRPAIYRGINKLRSLRGKGPLRIFI